MSEIVLDEIDHEVVHVAGASIHNFLVLVLLLVGDRLRTVLTKVVHILILNLLLQSSGFWGFG
ncbi:MAG: hypothetical protein ACKO96_44325, partial [Flammeovirgaceae bacterium]